MALTRSDLDDETIKVALQKFQSHPLLDKNIKSEVWTFKQEQVEVLLLANQILRWSEDALKKFTSSTVFDGSRRQDVANTIMDLLISRGDQPASIRRVAELCFALTRGSGESRKLAATLALVAVDRLLPSGNSHADRRTAFLQIVGSGPIAMMDFSGSIARYDFRSVHFLDCRFEGVSWANCKFDETTRFEKCRLVRGVPPAYCEGFGRITLIDCQLDPEAAAIFNNEKIKEGKKQYLKDDLGNDFKSVINKFVIKDVTGVKSVSEFNLTKGVIGASRYRDDIVSELLNTVLERHVISGGFVGYNVRPEAMEAVRFYAANNVFTGPLRIAFDALSVRLGVK